MPRMTREDAVAILQNRPLYNRDFQDAKSVLSLSFEKAHEDQVRKPFFWSHGFENLPQEIHELDYLDWSLHRVPGLQKKVRGCKADDPCLTAMILLLNDWEPVAELVAAAKQDVIKGRKPPTTPRKTPVRTLENTGTCPVCGMNVKLLGGRIVDHGFQLLGHGQGRSINCPGVNYEPWEVSPAGKIMYIEVVRGEIKRTAAYVEDLQIEPDADVRKVQRDLAIAESNLRFHRKTLRMLEDEITNWTAQPLPGEK